MNKENVVAINQKTQADAEKHYRRHARPGASTTSLAPGLTLTQNEDGLWLNFKSGTKIASVHMDMIGPHQLESDVRKAIDAWQADFAMMKDH